jgi:uncharacterized protein
MAVTLTELFIYPVKSLKGVRLERSALDIRGLADDRRWMIIDADNRFVSQRSLHAMATLHTQLTDDALRIRGPLGELRVTRAFAGRQPAFSARIWHDEVQVLDEGPLASQWLTDSLKHPTALRLVRLADQPRPQSKPQYLGQAHTVFADMAPLLVANQASLDALNRALRDKGETPVPMDRFRPNLVLQGLNAFAEHRIQQLRHADFQLHFAYPCERCVMTTVDQLTGQRHPGMEPYKTLTGVNAMPAYGAGAHHKAANPKAPAFGENAYLSRHGPAEGGRSAVGRQPAHHWRPPLKGHP